MTKPDETDSKVPLFRPDIATGLLKATKAVPASVIRSIGACYNWATGRSRTYIPAYHPEVTLTSGTSSHAYVFAFHKMGRRHDGFREYLFEATSTGTTNFNPGKVTAHATFGTTTDAPSVTTRATRDDSEDVTYATWQVYRQATEDADDTMTMTVTGADVTIRTIAAWDLPRPWLFRQNVTIGVPLASVSEGDRIDDDTDHGWYWVNTRGDDPKETERTYFHWSVPYQKDGSTITDFALSTTSLTYVSAFALEVPVLAQDRDRSASTNAGNVQFRAHTWVGAGGGGDVRIVSSKRSDSHSESVSSTSPGWVGSSSSRINVDSEDVTTSDGLQTASWDTVDIQFRTTATGVPVYLSAVRLFDRGL